MKQEGVLYQLMVHHETRLEIEWSETPQNVHGIVMDIVVLL